MRGLPDWGRSIDREGARLYAPFERDAPLLALPDTLSIALEPDGRPAFRVTAIRALGPGGARAQGRIEMELQLTSAAAGDGARAVPAVRGWLRLRSAMLDVPAELQAPIELDCSGLGLARLTVPLAPEGVLFVERALGDGALPVLAAVDVEVAGVAPRVGGSAIVDVARLGAALAGGATTPAELRDLLMADPAAVGVTLVDVPDAEVRAAAVAEAVVDHIRSVLCAGPLLPRGDGGLGLAPLDPAMVEGRATLDLGRAVVATRAIALDLDPFLAARMLVADRGGPDALVVRGSSAPLQTGRHRVTIDAGVRRPMAGPLGLGATLAFAPRPPARMHAVRSDVDLPPDGSGVEIEVHLAPGEPLDWTLAGFAFWPTADGRGVEQLSGPETAGAGTQALLRPSAFPLAFFDVEAEPALLALAAVSIAVAGARQDQVARAAVTLAAVQPRAGLALPGDAADPQMTAELTPLGGGAAILLAPRPAEDWRIELADVPGYGPRAVEIAVALPEATPLAAIEVLAEDAGAAEAPTVYAFTGTTAVRVHRWFCRDPFRPGLRWRWRGAEPFSAPVRGVDRLDLAPEGAAA